MKQTTISNAILYIDDLFKKHDITYWLEAGTLLGMIRERRVLPWTSDGDLTFLRKDTDKIKKIITGNPNYKLREHKHFSVDTINGEHMLCLIPAVELKGYMVKTQVRYLKYEKMRGLIKDIFPLKTIEYERHQLPIPNNAQEYLRFHYGNWKQTLKYGGDPDRDTGMYYHAWEKAIVYPGKFDPIHTGHIMQIGRLLHEYKGVIVDIYNYPNRTMPIEKVQDIIQFIYPKNVMTTTYNNSHKTHIPHHGTRRTYATGNPEVRKNLIKHQCSFITLKRYPGYKATYMKEMYKNER